MARAIGADRIDEGAKSKLGDLIAEALQRFELGIALALFADGFGPELNTAGRRAGPNPAARFDQRLETVFAERAGVIVKAELIVAPDVEHAQHLPARFNSLR